MKVTGYRLSFVVLFALAFAGLPFARPLKAVAQEIVNPDKDQPLEITAEETLEWHRNNKQYIARGAVAVTQGGVTIHADTLTADYREGEKSSFDIYRLSAAGNVRIVSDGNTATGEQAVYDVDKGVAVMTGNNLSLQSPDQTLTAKDSFEYWVAQGRVTASGSVHVVRAGDTLDSDRASAVFKEDSSGSRQLESLSADGHVRITTPDEILSGDKARYNAATNVAELIDHVRITRGPNILEGARAEVNLTTNVSKMEGSPAQGGRVRGVFYPGSTQTPILQQEPPQKR